MRKYCLSLLLIPVLLLFTACTSFVNEAHKTIYATTMMADGGMQAYGVWWKEQVVKAGSVTPDLNAKKEAAKQLSFKVGTALNTAERMLETYEGKVGTNTTTKAVVNGLIQTAVQNAGDLIGELGILTGNTNLFNIKIQ